MLFENSVCTSKRTPHFTVTEINWLMLFKEIIAVYIENHTKPINTKFSITDLSKQIVHIVTAVTGPSLKMTIQLLTAAGEQTSPLLGLG
jgi:hypothetical protein